MTARARRFGPSRQDNGDESPTRPVHVVEPATRSHGLVVETTGLYAGRPHPIPREGATVGRSGECVVHIDHEALSRLHARVVRLGEDYVLEDMGSLNGCFVADRRVTRAVLRDGDRVRLGSCVDVRFHLVSEEEKHAIVRVYEAGLRDPLTGLANRKQLEETLRRELSFAQRHGTDLVLVMADVDRFKVVNDAHGHLAGDAVLTHVAQVLRATVRTEDLVSRFGGEEFVVVARDVSLAGGRQLAERLRVALQDSAVGVQGVPLRVTASFGVASLAQTSDASLAGLLASADGRMYRAKTLGRNRVVAD
jgi:two-component system cell cycle response regulator